LFAASKFPHMNMKCSLLFFFFFVSLCGFIE
jgi:hypothetical protein